MEEMGTTCRDVRTREVGITEMHKKIRPQDVELTATLRKIFFLKVDLILVSQNSNKKGFSSYHSWIFF